MKDKWAGKLKSSQLLEDLDNNPLTFFLNPSDFKQKNVKKCIYYLGLPCPTYYLLLLCSLLLWNFSSPSKGTIPILRKHTFELSEPPILSQHRSRKDLKKIAWIWSHHLQWKFKSLAVKFTWGAKAKHCWALSTNFWKQKVCWHHSAIFYLITLFEFSPKVMASNPGYLLKYFLL